MAYEEYKPRESELRMVGVVERQQAEIERLRAGYRELRAFADATGLVQVVEFCDQILDAGNEQTTPEEKARRQDSYESGAFE